MALTFWIEIFIVILLLASFMVLIGLYVDRRETNFQLGRLSKEIKIEKPPTINEIESFIKARNDLMKAFCQEEEESIILSQDTSLEEPLDIECKNR